MSEEEDSEISEVAQFLLFMEKCSDDTLILHKLSELLEEEDRDSLKMRKLKFVLIVLIQTQMHQANNFRNIIKILVAQKELDLDTDELGPMEGIDVDGLTNLYT